jgi:protein gp37
VSTEHPTVGRGTTAIEWATKTWNPVTGCSKVSPGCAHCYIERTPPFRIGHRRFEHGATDIRLHPERLDQPLHHRKPEVYFVNSLSDLFHEDIPYEFVREVFNTMRLCDGGVTAATGRRRPRHIFLVLTKRPERMLELASTRRLGYDPASPPPNVGLGVTIENRRFVGRADLLRQTPAAVRFISAEPLLGPLLYDDRSADGHYATAGLDADEIVGDTTIWHRHWRDDFDGEELDLDGIDWLICGGESGQGARPMRLEWARDLRDACLATRERCTTVRDSCHGDPEIEECICGGRGGTAFFFKQHGGRTPKAGGRLLDGRTWDEMPEVAHA